MLFLYGELMVLLLVSFAIGAAVAAVVTRALVKETASDLPGHPSDLGGGAP